MSYIDNSKSRHQHMGMVTVMNFILEDIVGSI